MQLSVIIVSYNVKYFLEQCLCAVNDAIANLHAEVWVVDNASTDGTIEYLHPKFPSVKFIANATNMGFGKANNQALKKAAGKYVLFLNPDTIVPEDAFEKCIKFLENNASAGALGVKMIDGMGQFLPESKRSFPAPLTSFYKLSGLSKLFPRSKIFGKYALAYLNENQNHVVDVISGAYLFCQREILCKVNGFDEAFFMYGEDIDLSYRIQKEGFTNWYFSETTIIHFKGESSHKGSIRYIKIFYEAMIVFVQKHYSGGIAALFAVFFKMGIWIRAGVAAVYYAIKSGFHSNKQLETNKLSQYAIIGEAEEQRAVQNMLAKAGRKPGSSTTISDQASETALTLKIKSLLKSDPQVVLIFCAGHNRWKAIINMLTQLSVPFVAKFHAKNSGSIVGSQSKDKSGEVIAGL